MGTPLALGEQATTVYVDPHEVTRPRAEAVTAARVLGLKPDDVFRALATRDTHFVYVARKASPKLASVLARKKLPGFHFYGEERRSYPQGSVAAQVLGYAGVDNKGLSGLELQLDPQLTGAAGSQTVVRDPTGRPIAIQSVVPAREGKAAFLTLDHTIQANAEQVLRATVAHWHAKSATAIVLDPKTGGVLAMAMQPGYDANQVASKGLQGDHAVSDVFEPGSVFKVVTIAGALSEGLVTPQTTFTLPYSIKVADRVIHDAEPRGTETMTVAQILQRSSNVGTVTIARTLLGEARLKRWIKQFGFGRQTGIDFPGESAGLLPTYWSGSTIGNVPIGQGVSVTAIQLASVYAAIANRGVWKQPHLVDHVQGEKPAPIRTRRILSAGVDRELLTMLKGVVSDTGTGAGGERSRLQRRRQDGHGAEAEPERRLRGGQVRRDLRRHGSGERSPAPDPRHGRRAAARDLRRRRRRARLRADRGLRPPVPRGSARPTVQKTGPGVGGPEGGGQKAAGRRPGRGPGGERRGATGRRPGRVGAAGSPRS